MKIKKTRDKYLSKRFYNFFFFFFLSRNSFTRNSNVIAKEFCLLLRAFAVTQGKKKVLIIAYRSTSFRHTFSGVCRGGGGAAKMRRGGRCNVRCKSQVSIHVTGDSWRMNERTSQQLAHPHESWLLSYFHRRRKFNALSSLYARRYTPFA